jgi:hypothetical protein
VKPAAGFTARPMGVTVGKVFRLDAIVEAKAP